MSNTDTKQPSIPDRRRSNKDTRKTIITGDSPLIHPPVLTDIQPLVNLATISPQLEKQEIIDISELHSSEPHTLSYSELTIHENRHKLSRSHLTDFLLRAVFAIITALMILGFLYCVILILVEANKPRSKT